ncbi:MAG: VOC family protein [Acidobacteriota bacterium]
MLEKIEACVLPVASVHASLSFYQELLGLEVVDESPDAAILKAGEQEIVLLSLAAAEREPKFAGAIPGGAVAIHLRVTDPDGLWERIRRAARILEPLGDREYGDRDFTVLDPDGYRLVLGRALHA